MEAAPPAPGRRGPEGRLGSGHLSADRVPRWLHSAAAWSWRLLLVAAVVVVLAFVFDKLRLVFIPFFVALFLATFLAVPARWLRGAGFRPAAASATVLLVTLLVFGGMVALIEPQITGSADRLSDGVTDGVEEIGDWLVEGPLGLSRQEIDDGVADLGDRISDNREAIAGGVVSGALVALEVVIGAVLSLFILFFLLKDGDRMWRWFVSLFADARQPPVDDMGRDSWQTLGHYFQVVTLAALFDAVFIGIALAIIGVPLVIPLALLTFFAAYFPIVGAFTAGFVAVLVALVSEGFTAALLVLAAIVVVQQVESNVLYPLVGGRRLRLHPVAILLALTTGGLLAGIVGAFISTPVLAVIARALERARAQRDERGAPRGPPEDPETATAAATAGGAPASAEPAG